MSKAETPRHVIVAGDVLIDRHLYEGERVAPTAHKGRGVREVNQWGGACLLHRLIDRLLTLDRERDSGTALSAWRATLAVEPPPLNGAPPANSGYAIWKPFPARGAGPADKDAVWRASLLMGYGVDDETPQAPMAVAVPEPDLLVLDDASIQFRAAVDHEAWTLAKTGKGHVLLKMAEPLADGTCGPR